MGYRVTAPMVVLKVKDDSGLAAVRSYYEGAVVPESIDAENLKHHLDLGMVEEFEADTEPAQEPEDPGDPGEMKVPAKSASKAEWVEHVVAHHGVSKEDAEAATKDELVAAYGD